MWLIDQWFVLPKLNWPKQSRGAFSEMILRPASVLKMTTLILERVSMLISSKHTLELRLMGSCLLSPNKNEWFPHPEDSWKTCWDFLCKVRLNKRSNVLDNIRDQKALEQECSAKKVWQMILNREFYLIVFDKLCTEKHSFGQFLIIILHQHFHSGLQPWGDEPERSWEEPE